jgi:hypothetical protein
MPVKGKWIPDPDAEIRDNIRRVFTLYLVLGSAMGRRVGHQRES